MALADFHAQLMNDVSALASARGDHTRTTLVENLVARLVEAEELQDWSPAYFDGRSGRKAVGLDGYSTDELDLDGTIHILIADPRDPVKVATLTQTEAKAALGRAAAFVEEAFSGKLVESLEASTPAADFARMLMEHRAKIKTLRVLLLSTGAIGTRFKEIDREAIQGVKVELHVWDLTRFHQLAQAGGREPVEIDLTSFTPGGVPILPASIGATGYKAYLCVVPGALLADIYDQYGSRLLEGNVRAFLSARGNVNKGIRKTIMTAPDRFFAFNNGVTATATDAVVINNAGDHRLVRVRDLQIVNGGQTTASLFNTRAKDKADLTNVFVQMKLSVLPPDVAQELMPEISRFANTQNKVSDADLFANHPFHRKLEEMSRRIWTPAKPGVSQITHWFYERARAQYQTEQLKLTPAKQKEFLRQNPKEQVLTKTDVAKFENTWAQLPHLVSFGAQKNFVKFAEVVRERFDRSSNDFNDRWFQQLVAKAILFKSAERLVSSAPWYTGGYRANIVTYAIARLVQLVEVTFPKRVIDLDRIWKTQRISDATAAQLLACAEVAVHVLTHPPDEFRNVTEWAKKESCWKGVAVASVKLVPGLKADLKPVDEERAEQRDARVQEQETVFINAVVEVVRLGRDGYWRRALASPVSRRILSPTEYGILTTAARGGNWSPSDAQAKRLMAAKKRLDDEGIT